MALGKPVVTFLHEEAVERTELAFHTKVPDRERHSRDARPTGSGRWSRTPASAAAVGHESRVYVEQVHDIERVADRLLDIYARL